MARPFNFSAWPKFQDQPLSFPGKIYDRADNEGVSACPVGSPGVYGRALVRGPQSHPSTLVAPTVGTGTYAQADRYYTKVDSCCLPDKDRTFLMTEASAAFPAGQSFAAAGINLPVDAAGLLMPLGIGMWTEHGCMANSPLTQPFGLGDYYYQQTQDGQVGIATEGRIWAYCEEDINVGDALFFRTAVPPANLTDGLTLLGAFGKTGGADWQAAPWAKVFRPGPAGGAFVISLNGIA